MTNFYFLDYLVDVRVMRNHKTPSLVYCNFYFLINEKPLSKSFVGESASDICKRAYMWLSMSADPAFLKAFQEEENKDDR